MSKITFGMSLGITALLIHSGLSLRAHSSDAKQQYDAVVSENLAFKGELEHKQIYRKDLPMAISDAFTGFVNETKMLETCSGTRVNIVFTGTKENENIEDHYEATSFRNVKGLPIAISVEKFSNETDMAAVLNDIYLLENHTDFKVSHISTENNSLIVKGELYGI